MMCTRASKSGFLIILLFLGLVTAGVAALLFFWNTLLKPGSLGEVSLPLVAILAGVAATFNPCALPALPAFLTRLSEAERGGNRRTAHSFYVGLGAFTLVLLLGLLVAAMGEGLKPFVQANARWVQLGIGSILILLAGLHLAGSTSRLPLVGPVTEVGHRVWERVLREPSRGGSLAFGAGFVLAGVG